MNIYNMSCHDFWIEFFRFFFGLYNNKKHVSTVFGVSYLYLIYISNKTKNAKKKQK